MMKLSFHGGVKHVTGSCYLLQDAGFRFLIDCGMHQGQRICEKFENLEFAFDASNLDAVFLTHAHYDHCGRLPLLVKNGFSGPIYMTAPTKSLAELILRDAINIMKEQAEKCGDQVLYEEEDLETAISQMQAVSYGMDLHIKGVKVNFHDAGHILGSSFIRFSAGEDEIVFSGDLGNKEVPILPDTEKLVGATHVVCEATYGDRDHDEVSERSAKLLKYVKKIVERGGTAIIPAFSIERTQELIYELDELFDQGVLPKVPVFLDSPLAIKATREYQHFSSYLRFDRPVLDSPDRDFFSFDTLVVTEMVEESKQINFNEGPKIIISASGMMTGGRVQHHLKRYLPDDKSGVIIIGYQAEGTLGRSIQDGAKRVSILGDEIPVKAEIFEIESFSAHADRKRVLEWLKNSNESLKQVYLVHGDEQVKENFQKYLKEGDLNAEVIIPDLDQDFLLE